MTPDEHQPTLDALLAETAWVGALARSLVVDPGTADDVAQDAAVIALTRAPSDVRTPRGWLRRVAQRLASNSRRSSSRRAAREATVAAGETLEADAADEVVARWEVRKRVVAAVLALDEPYRSTVLLRFFDGLSVPETAARLGVPQETVRTRTRRGLDTLRGRLASLDDGRGRRGFAVLVLLARPEGDDAGPGVSAAFTANGVGGAAAGGVVMATATKWAAAAAILVLGLGMTWGASRWLGDGNQTDTASQTGDAGAAAAVKSPRARPPGASDATGDAAADGIDLDRCDRENDLFGVVLDPDGKPVAGAAVTILRARPMAVLLDGDARLEPLAAAETTTTRRDGTFALRLRRGDGPGLRVDAAGFAVWESNPRQAGERMTIRLVRAIDVTVVVTTHDGRSVTGAPVRAFVRTDESGNVMHGGRTDAEGRVRFDRLPRRAYAVFIATPANAPEGQAEPGKLQDAATQTVELTLEKGFAIRGVVFDAATAVRIAGARVRRWETFADAAVTDAGGDFEIPDVARMEEEIRVVADAPGYAQGSTDESDLEHVRIALEPAVRATGRVLDSGGRAVAGAEVSLEASWRSPAGHQRSVGAALTDADGHFAVGGLRPRQMHALWARAAGRARYAGSVGTPSQAPYQLDLGDIVLGAPHVIRGVAVDVEGRPVPRATVRLAGPETARDGALADWRLADDLGRFAFGELPPGTYSIDGLPTGPAEVSHVGVVVAEDGDPAPVTLVLRAPVAKRPTVPVTARVTDEDGRPVAGVLVTFGYAANGTANQAATGADGSATVPADFPALDVTAYVPPELGRDLLARTRVLLRPGQTDVSVVLRRGKLVSGRVVDEDGRGVGMAWVSAYDGATQAGSASANPEGRFSFTVPAGRKVDLTAAPPSDSASAKRSIGELWGVEPGAADLVVKVVRDPPSRPLDVDVVDESGAPIAGVSVFAFFKFHQGFDPVHGTTAADGRARLESVPRGPVELTAQIRDPGGDPNRWWGATPRRVPGDADTVRVVFAAPRVLTGRVRREDGSPCGGAVVHPNLGLMGSKTIAEVDGSFELKVPADTPVPFAVHASPIPMDPKAPMTGWDLVEAAPRELEIVVRPVPAR